VTGCLFFCQLIIIADGMEAADNHYFTGNLGERGATKVISFSLDK
jgi:hypothetical protein